MDPLDFLEQDQLLLVFHRSKTEMSCMENPQTFLSQLRDYDLIPEDKYKKVTRMKSKENKKKAIYDLLDWLEKKHSKHIKVFWKCVFKDNILSHYPTLKMLHNSLLDGSFYFDTQLSEKVEKEETDKEESPRRPEDEETETSPVRKKRNVRSKTMSSDDEQPGPSSQLTPGQKKKSKKICFSSPLKKGEKGDIWTWPIYKSQLPVTCGEVEGSLKRDRLSKGEKCIWAKKRWFTPSEFEKFAGKGSNKNWKHSIRCNDTPLGKLVQEGHLKSTRYSKGSKKNNKPLYSSNHSTTASEEENGEGEEDNQEDQDLSSETLNSSGSTDSDFQLLWKEVNLIEDMKKAVILFVSHEEEEECMNNQNDQSPTTFQVTCGASSGRLYKKRFALGTRGKSIRTDTGWFTPVEFVNKALGNSGGSWRKDIEFNGNPLSDLLKKEVLRPHSVLCKCNLCKPTPEDLDNQKNDDECYVCKSEGEEELVECDHCPRSFHKKCYVPHIEDKVVREDQAWMCTFCVFKTNQECLYPDEQKREDVMSHQMSRHMLECPYLLLYLYSTDEKQIFATNPAQYIENYSRFIETPMWLGKVAEKLQKKLYKTVAEFVTDVELIFTNCNKFNKSNAEYRAIGEHLKKLFDQEFRKAFNIHD